MWFGPERAFGAVAHPLKLKLIKLQINYKHKEIDQKSNVYGEEKGSGSQA